MSNFVKRCTCCHGTGWVELTGVYAETLKALKSLRRHSGVTGADLARLVGCKATAANKRLAALERMGLAVSIRWGRLRLYRAKEA